jgi:hypothetical protein
MRSPSAPFAVVLFAALAAFALPYRQPNCNTGAPSAGATAPTSAISRRSWRARVLDAAGGRVWRPRLGKPALNLQAFPSSL